MNDIKSKLINYCQNYLKDKLDIIQSELALAKESTKNESKSSAGDKHETGRAMAQLEQEKLSTQFIELEKQNQILTKINDEVINIKIGIGSIIETNIGIFFIAIPIGKVEIDNAEYFVISPYSPIGKILIEAEGSKTVFNQKEIIILKNY